MVTTGLAEAAGALPPGTRVDRWRVDEMLARGPESIVYAATDAHSGAGIAVKEYCPHPIAVRGDDGTLSPRSTDDHAAYTDGLRRFRDQARLLGALDHPGIVRLQGVADANGTAYMAMARLSGRPLEDLLRAEGTEIGEDEMRHILTGTADALEALHRHGYIHRDIKPGNLFLEPDGRVVLIDLGAARALSDEPEGGEVSELTPGYAAPEQHIAGGTEGPWTDIYGICAVAYRALTGEAPPSAAVRLEADQMQPAATEHGRFSAPFLAAIDAGLALDLAARPRSVAEWRTLLSPDDSDDGYPPTVRARRTARPLAAGDATATDPGAIVRPVRRRWTLKRIGLGVAAGLMVAALATAGYYAWRWEADRNRTEWRVDALGGGHTTTIAEAVARAAPGATIRVAPGVYAENLRLTAPVRVIGTGEAADDVVIAPAAGSCIAADAARGTLRMLSLRAAADAPCLDISAGRWTVEDSVIRATATSAVRIRGEADATVRRSTVVGGAAAAVLFEDAAQGGFLENRVTGGGKTGLTVRGEARPLVSANTISGAGQAGILVAGGAGGRFTDNEISGTGFSGIEIRGGADPTVTGNAIRDAGEAGIFVFDGGRGTLARNRITGNAYSGIVIGAGGAPEVIENVIRDNREHGILALDGARGRVTGNTISANEGHGIVLVTGAETETGDNALADNREPQVAKGPLQSGGPPE